MYFENEYYEVIREKLKSFFSLREGIFDSKEEMRESFNKHEDLTVTPKTFSKWLNHCGFKVSEVVIVHVESPRDIDISLGQRKLDDVDKEESVDPFDNEDPTDWIQEVKKLTPTERDNNG